MRMAIISVADLRNMTCANYYCGLFEELSIPFDIICTNRYETPAGCFYDCGLYQYDMRLSFTCGKPEKLKGFLNFRKYTEQLLNENHYDFLVIWGENALVLLGGLLRTYRGRFCYNKRDEFEGVLKPLSLYEKSIMRQGVFSTIPSPKGLPSLSGKSFVLTNYDCLTVKRYRKEKVLQVRDASNAIRVTYMGLISPYLDAFKRFLTAFGNDDRFVIAFYGESADTELKSFASSQGITNAVFGGAFSPEMTAQYLEETDIINSVYGGVISTSQAAAVGVKESYAPLLHIPVLSDKGTYWASISEKFGFGLGLYNDYSNAPNIVFDWYHSLDKKAFDLGCDNYVSTCYEGNEAIKANLMEMFRGEVTD